MVARREKPFAIDWNDADWDKLTNDCIQLWPVYPTLTLRQLTAKAQTTWPPDRRRDLSQVDITPLIDRVKVKATRAIEREMLGEPITGKTKDEILAEMSDEEIYERFAGVIFGMLTGSLLQH